MVSHTLETSILGYEFDVMDWVHTSYKQLVAGFESIRPMLPLWGSWQKPQKWPYLKTLFSQITVTKNLSCPRFFFEIFTRGFLHIGHNTWGRVSNQPTEFWNFFYKPKLGFTASKWTFWLIRGFVKKNSKQALHRRVEVI